MRAIKTTTISILAAGLLAGSAVGVAAQDDASEASESEVRFVSIEVFGPDDVAGEFTGFAGIPGGTTEWFSSNIVFGDYADSDTVGTAHTFDPGPPGGGTFQVQMNGEVIETIDSGRILAEGMWSVTPGSGTEEYEGLRGKGPAFVVIDPDTGTVTVVYGGTVVPTE